VFKYRAALSKGEELRYISHLDYASMMQRVINRSKLPAAYSEGFNPRMKISFATALPVGVIVDEEYMEFELKEDLPLEEVQSKLYPQLPPGVELLRLIKCLEKLPKLMATADEAVYEISFPDNTVSPIALQTAVDAFNKQKECIYFRITPKKKREIEVKQCIKYCLVDSTEEKSVKLKLSIKITPTGSIKPCEILQILQAQFNLSINPMEALVRRIALLGQGKPLV